MKVLFINHSDKGGGAEQFTFDLQMEIPNSDILSKYKNGLMINGDFGNITFLDKAIQKLTRYKSVQHIVGLHDSFHGTYKNLLRLPTYQNADIIHLNNIHGGWFELKCTSKN